MHDTDLRFEQAVLINSSIQLNHMRHSNYLVSLYLEEINPTTISFPSGTLFGVIKVIYGNGVIEA